MSYAYPTEKNCLRCGYKWRTRYQWLKKGEKATEPVRCARCRSPLWNKPKVLKSGPKSAFEREQAGAAVMVLYSNNLKRMLMEAGHRRGDGVSTAGIKLVSRVAKENAIRDWPHTRNTEDYEKLTDAVRAHLAMETELADAAAVMVPRR